MTNPIVYIDKGMHPGYMFSVNNYEEDCYLEPLVIYDYHVDLVEYKRQVAILLIQLLEEWIRLLESGAPKVAMPYAMDDQTTSLIVLSDDGSNYEAYLTWFDYPCPYLINPLTFDFQKSAYFIRRNHPCAPFRIPKEHFVQMVHLSISRIRHEFDF